MRLTLSPWRRFRARILGSLAVPVVCTTLAGVAWSESVPEEVTPAAAVAPAQDAPLTLSAARSIGLEQQPAMAAYRASLAAAQARAKAVDHLAMTAIIKHDIPYRRQQAAISVVIGEAGVNQAEWETKYAVTRTFLTVIYARQQLQVADSAIDSLKQLLEGTQRLVDVGAANVTMRDVDRVKVFFPVAEGRREEAAQGVELATAALREAMGVGADFKVQLAGKQLPWLDAQVSRDDVVNLALTRRGEMAQATGAMEITCLETKAQNTSRHLTVPTFASAGDIHARVVPQGISNGEYRPGAVPLEMPPTLVGSKSGRVEQAADLHSRAVSVAEKAKNLITLEADQTYLKWLENSRKVVKFREAADAAEKLARSQRQDLEKQGARSPRSKC